MHAARYHHVEFTRNRTRERRSSWQYESETLAYLSLKVEHPQSDENEVDMLKINATLLRCV